MEQVAFVDGVGAVLLFPFSISIFNHAIHEADGEFGLPQFLMPIYSSTSAAADLAFEGPQLSTVKTVVCVISKPTQISTELQDVKLKIPDSILSLFSKIT